MGSDTLWNPALMGDATPTISVHPPFEWLDDLASWTFRLCWYAAPFAATVPHLEFTVAPELLAAGDPAGQPGFDPPEAFDPAVRGCLDMLRDRVRFVETAAPGAVRFVWRADPGPVGPGSLVLDRHANPYEVDELPAFFASRHAPPEAARRNHAKFGGFVRLLRQHDVGRVVILAGGPSAADLDLAPYEADLLIVANTLISQDRVRDHRGPTAAVVADPYFAGMTRYAAAFRASLDDFLKVPNRIVLTLDRFAPYIAPGRDERIVGVPAESRGFPPDGVNLDLLARFVCVDAWNTATTLALPLACTVADTILLAGLDGRDRSSGTPWQSHRYTDLTQTLLHCHGVLPQGDDDAYYLRHERTLTAQIAATEALGKKIVSLTRSHFRAVDARFGG